MSYARFGYEDSDVYVYEDCYDGLKCCACSIKSKDSIRHTIENDPLRMIMHLRLHQQIGDTVPLSTFEQLEELIS